MWRSGTLTVKSWTYLFTSINTRYTVNYKRVYNHFTTLNIQYIKKSESLCGEVGHSQGKVGRHVSVFPIHAIMYSPSSPHAYQIYTLFTYSSIKLVNNI